MKKSLLKMDVDKKSIKMFILIFVVVLVGLAFATSIADLIYETSHINTQINETLNIASARGVGSQPNISGIVALSLAYPKLSSTTVLMYNHTDGRLINSGNYTVNLTGLDKNYNTYSIYLINNSYWGAGGVANSNRTLITYNYYPENYVPYSNARTILDLVGLFIALMILIVVIDYVMDGKLRELIMQR